MNLFDILRLAAERAAETGDEMRPEFHEVVAILCERLQGPYKGYPCETQFRELGAAAQARRDALRAAEEAQGKFAAIIEEATGGTAQ